MKIPYFPGCTLYNRAIGLNNSTKLSLAALGVELEELSQWTCCGTVFPLAQDNYMGMVPSARILANAAKQGNMLATVCSFCYNVLKRVNNSMLFNLEARQKLNDFIEEEYAGDVRVIHPLEIFEEFVGLDKIRDQSTGVLSGLKIACYYGCMLVRPASEMNFDDPDNPTIMDKLVAALGAEVVENYQKTTCCGSYQVLNDNDLVKQKVKDILEPVKARGAQAIVTSCPLCQFNLDWMQKKLMAKNSDYEGIPIIYFTQLVSMALQLPYKDTFPATGEHYIDPACLWKINITYD